jgi:single-stranded-DNA-specific exonuclease
MPLNIKEFVIPAGKEVDDNPIFSNILLARGIKDKKEVNLSLKNLIHFKFLDNIESAANLIIQNINKKILIVGDYDADGACSVALAVDALLKLGATNVQYLIPDRLTSGYGLNPNLIDKILAKKPALIITVDNGISARETVDKLNEENIKTIITDHHLPPAILPKSNFIINPKTNLQKSPLDNLAGVGVIFYLLLATRNLLLQKKMFTEKPNFNSLLALVAIGTVADMVPLDYNNRILVQNGLKTIRYKQCSAGVLQLCKIAGINFTKILSSDIGYKLAPYINAAGRIGKMKLAVDVLLAKDNSQDLCLQLATLNTQRKQQSAKMQTQAEHQLISLKKIFATKDNLFGICLYNKKWHEGIIGIIAGQICQSAYLPTIIFTDSSDDKILRGSARSIKDIHLRDLLEGLYHRHPDNIIQFGGHKMAAGLSLKKDFLSKFSIIFNKECAKILNNKKPQKIINTDGKLPYVHHNIGFVEKLLNFMPWGSDFPPPLFYDDFIILKTTNIKNKISKFFLQEQEGKGRMNAVYFNGIIDAKAGDKIKIVYELGINYFYDKPAIQLLITNYQL